ncbi:MAG: phytanoyl-CoA dioxygenase family protein [Gammaproteobacteria bacterium]|nr:phytanoyl-CoA dioxygenase family protein [Gammaproteobacteria bacterium]
MPNLPEKPSADDAAMGLALNDLGWVGNDPETAALNELRAYLEANNGIKGLEVVSPDEVDKARQLFYRDGFVVVRDVLTPSQLDYIRGGCDRVIHEIMSRDKNRAGNRGSHRYSFGGASLTGHQAHQPEWAMLIDLPSITPILTSIFDSGDYIARGGGGDFCLPGAVEYQRLHSDMNNRRVVKRPDGGEFTFGSFSDPRGQLTYRDLPCPYVCCNFLMVDFTPTNGPTRQIPATQHSHEHIPTLEEEPAWMKLSTICPAPAGSVLMRDVRAWHGGTPNLSNEVRALPNAEFFAPWYREHLPISMPRDIYDGLSEHGQWISRYIVADKSEKLLTGYRDDLGNFIVPKA